jgi:glutamyl-tRNA synthetase
VTSPSPRVRFAPAPTGYLHVGSARSALFNWLFARHHGGEFLVRVEDTDPERSRQELVDLVFRTLDWLGMDWDGEPVRQSERADLYRDAAGRLLSSGHAYACDCTQEQVKERTAGRPTPGYDRYCRDRGIDPGPGRVVRFRVPDEGTTAFDDVVRGHVSFENANLEDFVVVRSDGTATFLLPNAVDDLDMGITHVIRGEDLVNVTPKVLLIRQALGHDEHPVFAHLPLLVNEQRKKLSKRRDDVSVEDYRERGYLPEAMANYLALLGWGPPDGVEVRPMEEIVGLFRLEDVNKAPAFFDQKKLDHVNGEYLRQMSPDAFAEAARPWLERGPWRAADFDPKAFERLVPELQTRTVTLAQVPEMVDFLFLPLPEMDDASWQKAMVKARDLAVSVLDAVIPAYEACAWDASTLHETLRGIAESVGSGLAKVQAPVRVAVTGRTVGPPLFESLEVLGRERTLERLRAARDRL